MPSPITDYFSAFKKKHYDDLPDYDKGRLHGSLQGQLTFIGVSLAFTLFKVYKRTRCVNSDDCNLVPVD